ncbi:MAG: hypothetical protein HFE64_09030 [Lachnospiraceae bacterium]|jgi:hypothetical protein|nr:hypothetical protein [Lachnospiraceae bacterium]
MVEEIPPRVAEEFRIAEKIQLYFQFQLYSAQPRPLTYFQFQPSSAQAISSNSQRSQALRSYPKIATCTFEYFVV